MAYVIATSRPWHEYSPKKLSQVTGQEFILINKKDDLTFARLQSIKPRYVFFPHWSYKIPADIFNNYECVVFHMTDLPFGRGGSPLQNLIARGIYETKVTALKCEAEIDAGPVYLQKPFFLYGSAEEIYLRAARVIEEMIICILENHPEPIKQTGEAVYFERRKPEESNIASLTDLKKVFDFIRMLDADGYPKAFLETDHFRIEFERASLKNNFIQADVKISRKKGQDE